LILKATPTGDTSSVQRQRTGCRGDYRVGATDWSGVRQPPGFINSVHGLEWHGRPTHWKPYSSGL